jgi:hypothetical protein
MACLILVHDGTWKNTDMSNFGGDPSVLVASKRVWERVKDPNINVVFYRADSTLAEGEIVRDSTNTMRIHTKKDLRYDSVYDLANALHAVRKTFSCDFILTTTLGCYWVLPRLKEILERAPRSRLYFGRGWTHYPFPFISGSGILMTPDVADMLIDARDEMCSITEPNDVVVGWYLDRIGVPAIFYSMWMDFDFNTLENLDKMIKESDERGIVQYRVKNYVDRVKYDIPILERLSDYYRTRMRCSDFI